jgi:energy-coupling factor transport system permease protein
VPSLAADRGLPRALHPGAWWLWALGLATVASRTTNPLVLALVLATLVLVVTSRRSDAPWARSFGLFLRLALIVLAFRTTMQVLLGTSVSGNVLVTLPEVPLPEWAAGVSLGGPITDDHLAAALAEGLRLATMLACIGAANALANPKRLLASLPAALYEVGVAVVVALSFVPSLAGSVQRIRAARRLRGRPDRGVRGMASVALPVLEDALERSLSLAAAMDSRGYGRRAVVPAGERHLTSVLLLGGLAGICLGVYGLLDASGPPLLGVLGAAGGVVLAAVGLAVGGRHTLRTRYRPDPWRAPEWVTAGAGLAAMVASIASGLLDPAAQYPTVLPLTALPLPPVVVVGVLVAALPAWSTPPPPPSVVTSPQMLGAGAGADDGAGPGSGATSVSAPTTERRPEVRA